MLSFAGSLKVFVSLEPCDLRKSFNGLHGLATERLGEDPRQGALFVFTNRRRTRLKMLCVNQRSHWQGQPLEPTNGTSLLETLQPLMVVCSRLSIMPVIPLPLLV